MVSKAKEDLPDPERPVKTTNWSRGISTERFLRLWTRAPWTRMVWDIISIYRCRVRSQAVEVGAETLAVPGLQVIAQHPGLFKLQVTGCFEHGLLPASHLQVEIVGQAAFQRRDAVQLV